MMNILLNIISEKPHLKISELVEELREQTGEETINNQLVRTVLSRNDINLRKVRKLYGELSEYKLDIPHRFEYENLNRESLKIIANNPFLTMKEVEEESKKRGKHTNANAIRYQLQFRDLTLSKLRRKFGEESDYILDWSKYWNRCE